MFDARCDTDPMCNVLLILTVMKINIRVCVRAQVLSHHGDCERVDAADVVQAVLPGDEAFYIDEELVPQRLKGLVILLIPAIQDKYTHASHVIGSRDFLTRACLMHVRFILVGKADGQRVRWWNYQADGRHLHIQSSRSGYKPFTALRVIL